MIGVGCGHVIERIPVKCNHGLLRLTILEPASSRQSRRLHRPTVCTPASSNLRAATGHRFPESVITVARAFKRFNNKPVERLVVFHVGIHFQGENTIDSTRRPGEQKKSRGWKGGWLWEARLNPVDSDKPRLGNICISPFSLFTSNYASLSLSPSLSPCYVLCLSHPHSRIPSPTNLVIVFDTKRTALTN